MIKSLYVRTVFIFIFAVMVSLLLAFFVATQLYSNQVQDLSDSQMIVTGKQIISIIQKLPPGNSEVFEAAVTMPNFRVKIVDQTGATIAYSDGGSGKKMPILDRQVNQVISGGVYHGTVSPDRKQRGPVHFLTGLPFQYRDKPYALFISPEIDKLLELFRKVTFTILLSVLAVGSLLSVLASSYIVKPVQRLTIATKRMAQGDFALTLQSKRKDEIGVLTASFNEMAGSLRMIDKLRSDFVNNVAHEFQSPLTSITGFTKALRTKTMEEVQRQHYLQIIEEESQRLSRLSANLLRLSVLEHDKKPAHPSTFRLDEQIRRIIIASEPQWHANGLTPDLTLDDVTIFGDEDSLNQVWHNLISNSIKFAKNSVLAISLAVQEGMAVVTVSDQGKGIPQEELAHIFTPFYKVDKSRDYAVKGNGLGLSIVKRIVELHEGTIEVSSKPDVETVFTVRLPLNRTFVNTDS
ncbi:cell wall metabolism sensor histidine kinase WalK [Paenibacillus sp. OV219]|uniref:sensor histidine kinase n=1 Tax=Paenibacillus sp. OV219 TaxID=1884377 RepID=UPI0008B9C412|nr:HAMP domain-containing sensor histidine kinase [Paenibacillus sp. OV219]SEM58199.1 Signal transduction histidine kinase [Paenibacillus sp. OV219]